MACLEKDSFTHRHAIWLTFREGRCMLQGPRGRCLGPQACCRRRPAARGAGRALPAAGYELTGGS